MRLRGEQSLSLTSLAKTRLPVEVERRAPDQRF
jgi:hypothetical protein